MYYIIHVVIKSHNQIWDEIGEFVQAEFSDFTLAHVRCKELNDGINLKSHHYCVVRETADGLPKSEMYEKPVV